MKLFRFILDFFKNEEVIDEETAMKQREIVRLCKRIQVARKAGDPNNTVKQYASQLSKVKLLP